MMFLVVLLLLVNLGLLLHINSKLPMCRDPVREALERDKLHVEESDSQTVIRRADS